MGHSPIGRGLRAFHSRPNGGSYLPQTPYVLDRSPKAERIIKKTSALSDVQQKQVKGPTKAAASEIKHEVMPEIALPEIALPEIALP